MKISREHRLFAACLFVLLSVCACVMAAGTFKDPLPEFTLGANEILQTHHIYWDFLPIGYSSLLGWSYVLGSPWGESGMHQAAMAMHTLLLVLTFVLVRALLRYTTSARFASLAALVICLDPELLQALKKVKDTNATFLALLLILLAMVKLRRRPSIAHALLAGISFGMAVVLRPNLALMPVLLTWALWPTDWKRRVQLCVVSLGGAVAFYCGVTTIVHGKPFFPQNGFYNLYAGANAHTQESLINNLNAEPSIVDDMRARGYDVAEDWRQPVSRLGLYDVRSAAYRSYYHREALRYIRQHPIRMVGLSLLKFADFLRPETNRYRFSDFMQSTSAAAWLTYRSLRALIIPGWLILLFCWRKPDLAVILLTFLYILPFVLINADPRFRAALDGVLMVDMARMLYVQLKWRRSIQHAESRVACPSLAT